MIKNEKEMRVTRSQLKYMREALRKAIENKSDSIDDRVHKATIAGIEMQIKDLEAEIREYEGLKKGGGSIIINDLEDLPLALIKARIARNLTQKQLADLLNMKPQQIQRYEYNEYYGVALHRIIEIGKALGIHFVVKPQISVSEKKQAIA